jgi:putative DNA-invertase from lambdoid prophage Rac
VQGKARGFTTSMVKSLPQARLLVELTQAGLARARAEGRTLGRLRKTNQEQRAAMVTAHQRGESISSLARLYAVSRSTVLATVKEESKEE